MTDKPIPADSLLQPTDQIPPPVTYVPVSSDEIRRLRKMLESHERAVWLWTAVGMWAKWIISVAAAAAVLQAALKGLTPWGVK